MTVQTEEILGILDMAAQRRTSESYSQTTLYKEHVRRAAEVIRALEQELKQAQDTRKQKCERAAWCVHEDGHVGDCSLIRPRMISVTPLSLGMATDALNLADEFLDDVHEEGDGTRKRKVQVEIDIALEELARAQGHAHVRAYDDAGRSLHGEDDE